MPTDLPSLLELAARLLIGGCFLEAVIRNRRVFAHHTAHIGSRGVPYPRAAMLLATVLQAVCAMLLIVGVWVPWATIGLILFTLGATYLFHNFWDMDGDARNAKLLTFRGNLIIIGGLVALLALTL